MRRYRGVLDADALARRQPGSPLISNQSSYQESDAPVHGASLSCPLPVSPHWWPWALLLVTLLGGGLRFGALAAKTIWLDEAFSLWMANHNLPILFAWLIRIDHHPPLYYTLLHTWIGWFGDSPSALRSLSALASTLAIPLYALAARKLAGAQVGIVAALLLAVAPFQVRYAQETRMYALLTLAVALLFFALAEIVAQKDPAAQHPPLWAWGLLALSEAAAMLTHNTATVLLPLALNVAVGGLWLAKRRGWLNTSLSGLERPGFYRCWLLSQGATLLLWLPWAWPFVRQAQVVDADFWIAPPDFETVWAALNSLTFGDLPHRWPIRGQWAWLGLALAFMGLWHWRKRARLAWLLLSLWLLPPLVELLVSLRRPIFYDRTLIWTTLPYYLLIARGMVPLGGLRSLKRGGWLLLYLFLCGLGLWSYYVTFEKEDWDEVAAYVASYAQPHDLILFNASWGALPFNYHYPTEAPPLERHGVPADLFDAGVLEPPMTAAGAPRVRRLIDDSDQVWLVYSHWWYTDPESLLLQTLDEQLELVETKEWQGIQVVRYKEK